MHPHFRYPAAQAATNLRRDFDDRDGHGKPGLVEWTHAQEFRGHPPEFRHTVTFLYEDGTTTKYDGTKTGG